MALLIIGVLVWSLTHLFPALLPARRERLFQRLGEYLYKGLYSLPIFLSVILIVLGWRLITPANLYVPPMGSNLLISLLVLTAFVLFAASAIPGNIRRLVRHPQMTATILWGVAHLLANGSNRAVVLFGGMTAWAVLEILLINQREGEWQRPAPAAAKYDVITAVVGITVFSVLVYFHRSLFGVAAISG